MKLLLVTSFLLVLLAVISPPVTSSNEIQCYDCPLPKEASEKCEKKTKCSDNLLGGLLGHGSALSAALAPGTDQGFKDAVSKLESKEGPPGCLKTTIKDKVSRFCLPHVAGGKDECSTESNGMEVCVCTTELCNGSDNFNRNSGGMIIFFLVIALVANLVYSGTF